VLGEHAAHDVLVEIHVEDIGNLLGNAHRSELGITIAAMSEGEGDSWLATLVMSFAVIAMFIV
jgi:hypothetical protein